MALKRLVTKTPADQFEHAVRADRRFGATFKVLFDQENRLRALEGQAPLNPAQFKARLKAWFTE